MSVKDQEKALYQLGVQAGMMAAGILGPLGLGGGCFGYLVKDELFVHVGAFLLALGVISGWVGLRCFWRLVDLEEGAEG